VVSIIYVIKDAGKKIKDVTYKGTTETPRRQAKKMTKYD
jgi:hypothetical protein